MSWKSAIEQKRYILSAVLLYCNMQGWSVGSGSCTVSTTGIVTVTFSLTIVQFLDTLQKHVPTCDPFPVVQESTQAEVLGHD